MGTPYKNAAGLTPEDVYDPDVVGDGPDAAINGIGYRNAAGVLLRFAALKYGTAAANHGYRLSDGRDFSALWAAKGTAVYTLPINGKTFSQSYTIPAQGSGWSLIGFRIVNGDTWQVYGTSPASASPNIYATGALPIGASSLTTTFTDLGPTSGSVSSAGGVTNGAASATAVSGNPNSCYLTSTGNSSSGSRDRQWSVAIDFTNVGGASVSHTVIKLQAGTEGSV